MTVDDAIRIRKSVRAYADEPIGQDTLRQIMEQVRLAPSARNLQEWRFVIVTDPVKRTMLGEAANGQRFVGEAPVVIVACAETDGRLMSCGHPSFLVDVSIAVDHLMLAATDVGLGTCWIGAFDPARVREILGIPKSVEVVAVLPMGYPANPKPEQKQRLAYETIVRENSWE
jgi:nitroreductase